MFAKLFLKSLLLLIPFSICSTWESPVTIYQSLKVSETEGENIKCFGLSISPASGDVYFSDNSVYRIFRIFDGELRIVAGIGISGFRDGPFLSAQFGVLGGMAFGPNGSFLLVADLSNHVIRLLDFQKETVSTIAGTPNQPGMADGTRSKFNGPYDVVVDSRGIIAFVADSYNHRIRKIDLTNGNVTTVAGTGLTNFNGLNGPAIKVNLNYPKSIMFQEVNNLLFFSDENCAIRMVDGTGYLTTILRDCDVIPYPWGIVQKDNSTILVSDFDRNIIISVNVFTSSSSIFAGGISGGFFDGTRLEATFSSPTVLAVDPKGKGDVYVSDYSNVAIRKISFAGYVSTELKSVGSGFENGLMGMARFNSPTYLVIDDINSILYISDTINHAIRRIYLEDNYKVDVLTGKSYGGYVDGSLETSLFSFPRSLVLDQQNNSILYVADSGNYVIRAIYLNLNLVNTTNQLLSKYSTIILQEGVAFEAPIRLYNGYYSYPFSVAPLNNDTFIFSNSLLNSIWLMDNKFSSSPHILTGSPTNEIGYKDGEAKSAKFNFPIGLALQNESLFIADYYNYVIRSLDMGRSVVTTYFGSGKQGHRNGPSSISELKGPNDIKIDRNGILYVVDEQANAIRAIKGDVIETIAGFGAKIYKFDINEIVFGFDCLVRVSNSQFLVSDKRNNVIFSINLNTTVYNIKPEIGSGMIGFKDGKGLDSMLKAPTDLALSPSNSMLYIADSGNQAIRAYDIKSGYLSTLFTSLSKPSPKITLKNPQGIAIDTVENKLFISDTDNHCIKVMDLATGTLTLLAGSRGSSSGFKNSWFGEFALFAYPLGIVVSMNEKFIYVCDSYNHAIRKVLYNGTVTTFANNNGLPGYLDGNISTSNMLHPTKLALSAVRNELYILDSGNYRIRMIDIESRMMKTVLDTRVWPITSIHIDGYDNLFANSRRAVKLFKRMQSTTSHPDTNNFFGFIAILLVCLAVTMLASVTCYFAVYRRFRKEANVAHKLDVIGRNSLLAKSEQSNTLNTSKTVAISMPGHLCIDRSLNQISFEENDLKYGKSGGTAKVIKGKLKDPEMISKFGVLSVAIKVFNHNEVNKQTVVESFRYEVALMAALPESPYLIRLIGYCLDPMVIVMKHYGMNMEECLQSKKFFTSPNIKIKSMLDITEGMNIVHSKDIIHFDLKPGNILLDLNFQSECKFVICDFGFSDFVDEAGRQFVAGMKKPSVQGITIRYAAPELFLRSFSLSHKEILKKVDIYAFAMIAYYIWFNIKPWGSEKMDEIQGKVLKSERPQFPENSDKEIIDLIQKCWNQDPTYRPTFENIIKDIKSSFQKEI